MKKIGVLVENRFIDQEIIYYQNRFPEAGIQVDFLTRLWGQNQLTFKGLELGMQLTVDKSFEGMTDEQLSEYAAFIMPAGYVADMLRYAEKPGELSPAVRFMQRLMGMPEIIKCVICHSMWIFDPIPESVRGRRVTCHNNVIGSVQNTGAVYVNEDFVWDNDLLSVRTGGQFSVLARELIARLGNDADHSIHKGS